MAFIVLLLTKGFMLFLLSSLVTKQLQKQKELREKINERLETAKGRSKKALETKLYENARNPFLSSFNS